MMGEGDTPDNLLDRNALLGRLSVALVRTAYPGNIGAAARVMTNFGVRRGTLVSPRCDSNSVEARQYATGPSALTLATMNTVKSLVDCSAGYSSVIALTRRTGQLRKPSVSLSEIPQKLQSGQVLLVFGPEEDGLSDAEIKQCTDVLTLDVSPMMPSLNLSHAVAVVLSHTYDRLKAVTSEPAPASVVDATELLSLFGSLEANLKRLQSAGKLANAERLSRLLSQTLSRAQLDEHELAAWHGFLSLLK
jgi:TrmH family RNA methyltransferase